MIVHNRSNHSRGAYTPKPVIVKIVAGSTTTATTDFSLDQMEQIVTSSQDKRHENKSTQADLWYLIEELKSAY